MVKVGGFSNVMKVGRVSRVAHRVCCTWQQCAGAGGSTLSQTLQMRLTQASQVTANDCETRQSIHIKARSEFYTALCNVYVGFPHIVVESSPLLVWCHPTPVPTYSSMH